MFNQLLLSTGGGILSNTQKDAQEAYKTLTVTGIGTLPQGGSNQNIGHNANIYLIHERGRDVYYGCGKVGTKIVFGMRSDDENYFSTVFHRVMGVPPGKYKSR